MFTPVLHYDFRARAAATDVSGRNLHGTSTGLDFRDQGWTTERGAAVFSQPHSRIRTVSRDPFWRLTALKIEVSVFLEDTALRQNLIEGFLSFAFYVSPTGALVGTARASTSAGGGWSGVDSVAGSPDGVPRTVPFGRWCTLTYIHDGFANLVLLIDGEIAASTNAAPAPLQTVGWRGVHIGNWPDADHFVLRGMIGEVKVWRWDPLAVGKQFATRNPTPCWAEVGRALTVAASNRERLARLYRCIIENQQRAIKIIRRRGDGHDLVRRFAEGYRSLWAQGRIDDAEVTDIIQHLLGSLEGEERAVLDQSLHAMMECFTAMELDPSQLDGINFEDCDPGFVKYITNLSQLLGA